jgi:hypothetical protein
MRGILRNSPTRRPEPLGGVPKPLPSFAKATEGSPRLHPRSKLRSIRRRRINGTEAEDQAIRQGYQNTDKQATFRFLMPILEGVAEVALYCAHRTRLQMIPPSSLASLSRNGTRVGPTAAVERAHSDRARSGSKGATRVSFHPFHRARSGSKGMPWL